VPDLLAQLLAPHHLLPARMGNIPMAAIMASKTKPRQHRWPRTGSSGVGSSSPTTGRMRC
jgi:hypothetical protein